MFIFYNNELSDYEVWNKAVVFILRTSLMHWCSLCSRQDNDDDDDDDDDADGGETQASLSTIKNVVKVL